MARRDISRTEVFESMPVFKAILSLAIPNVINQLAGVIYNLADTFFIGKLNNSSMVSSLGLTMAVMMTLMAVASLFNVGSCTVISAALGSKNKKKAEDISTFMPFVAAAAGLLLSLVIFFFGEQVAIYSGASETNLVYTMDYQFWVLGMNAVPYLVSTCLGSCLRGNGYAKYEMYGITLGNILNIVLDPICILGLGMGVAGAGFATFISTCVSACFLMIMASRLQKKAHVYSSFSELEFNLGYLGEVAATGFPAFLHAMLASLTNTFAMNIYSTYSDAAVAAVTVTRKIEHFFGEMVIGLNMGTIPLVSYNYSSKNYKRLNEVRKKTIILCVIWGLVAAAVLFPFAKQFVVLFINDPETIKWGTPMVRMYAFIVLTMGFNNNVRTTLQALRKKKYSTMISFLRQIILFLPGIYILNKAFGFYGAVFTPLASDLICDVIGFFLLNKVMSDIKKECELDA